MVVYWVAETFCIFLVVTKAGKGPQTKTRKLVQSH